MTEIIDRNPTTLQLHEASEQVPRMRPEEWVAFLADVDAQGVLEPLVITPEGVILDGRHRWDAAKACQQENVPTREVHLTTVEQVQFIFRAALLRRHLSDDQRAVLAARFREPLSKAVVEERARAGGYAKAARSQESDAPESCLLVDAADKQKIDTRADVAQQFNVSQNKVRQATELHRDAPRLAEQVLAGDVSLRDAQRQQAKTAQAELVTIEEQTGVNKRQDVQRQRLRSRFADTMNTLGEIEPDELVEAYTERDPETLPAYLRQLHEWGERVNTLLNDRSLRVLKGGRSS